MNVGGKKIVSKKTNGTRIWKRNDQGKHIRSNRPVVFFWRRLSKPTNSARFKFPAMTAIGGGSQILLDFHPDPYLGEMESNLSIFFLGVLVQPPSGLDL